MNERSNLSTYELAQLVEDNINEKYLVKRPLTEARNDAILYAATQLACILTEAQNLPEDKDENLINYYDKTTELWRTALNAVISGNWYVMKDAINNYTQSSFEGSSQRLLIGVNLEEAALDLEKRALALNNFANSLL